MILVLTAGFGDGHNSAARRVAEGLARLQPGLEVRRLDLLEEVHPLAARAFAAAYRSIITHCPAVWRWIYDVFARPEVHSSPRGMTAVIAGLADLLEATRPQVIVSTFPLYASLLAVLRDQGIPCPPLVTVITDSVTVHPAWTCARSDKLCVPDEETKASALGLGVPEADVMVTGFPVSLVLAEKERQVQPQHRRLIYMPSTTAAHVRETMEGFLPLLQQGNVSLTVLPGRHYSRLYQLMRRFQDAHPGLPVNVMPWCDDVPSLLLQHDVLVCKAGGAILHEALAACIPAVIDYVVPGQEEGNLEWLARHGGALRSESPAQTIAHVTALLANNAAQATQMSTALRQVRVADGALAVARCALELAR